MFKTSGLLLAFATVLLQISVFLQPLLPEQYQIASVCETISQPISEHYNQQQLFQSLDQLHQSDLQHTEAVHDHAVQQWLYQPVKQHSHHLHDLSHQCQYCNVYGNLILPPTLGVSEILVSIHVRILTEQKSVLLAFFERKFLYLLPQSRAPPFSVFHVR